MLASLTPAAAADIEAAQPPLFNLGDVVLVDTADAGAEHFDLGAVDLLDSGPLRGPPPSYPETRVRGFELLPPFRVGASPSLSLWSRQACGSISCEVASDSRYDPWGLADDENTNRELIRQRREYAELCAQGCIGPLPTERELRQAKLQMEAIGDNNRVAARYLAPKVAGDYIAIFGAGSQRSGLIETAVVPRLSDAKPVLIPPSQPVVRPPVPVSAPAPATAPEAPYIGKFDDSKRQTFGTGAEWHEYLSEKHGAENVEWTSGSGRTVGWPKDLPRPSADRLVKVPPPPRSKTFVPELVETAGPRPPGAVAHHVDPIGLAGADNGRTNGAWLLEPSHQRGHGQLNRAISSLPYGTEIRVRLEPSH